MPPHRPEPAAAPPRRRPWRLALLAAAGVPGFAAASPWPIPAAGLLALAALISINLGILNLLPIPVLDGGHILFLCLEMVSGRKVPERVQEITTSAGFFLLLLLMGLVIFNDIIRLATGAEF